MRTAIAAASLLIAGCGAPGPTAGTPYVNDAVAVGAWLRSIAGSLETGPWPDDARAADATSADLANGIAGKVWFFLALHDATGDATYLDDVRRGADALVGSIATFPPGPPATAPRPSTSLYYGLPGICVVLDAVSRVTADDAYSRGAAGCLEAVKARAAQVDTGVEWSTRFDDLLFGNTGTALYLLHVARRDGDVAAGDLAVRAGRMLQARAVPEHGGLTWRFRRDADFVLPNFSHGTAGVGYLMAALSEYTGETTFLETARAAATYLDAIARTDGDVYLVPYGWPNPEWDGLYEAGWAHGAAGTARFFHLLARLEGMERYRARLGQAVRGIATLPAEDRIDMRFGAAGTAMFLVDAAEVTGDRSVLDAAGSRVTAILDAATREDGRLSWTTPRPVFVERPGEPAAYTGYLTGAAGYGMLLLRYAAALDGREWTWRLPDDPF